ncbi:hypothetical protein KIF59_09085 [Enterobacter cloacae subsp. cloacae]|nr:hypothetical protein [Enterobacter cloacae subsp. cloacae]
MEIFFHNTHHDPCGLIIRGGYTRTALSGPPASNANCHPGALLAWPTFGLHVEFDLELFLVLFILPLRRWLKTPTREFLNMGAIFRSGTGAGRRDRGRDWFPDLIGWFQGSR